MDQVQPTEEDIQYLRDNPDIADQYNTAFGEGAANAVLSPEPEEPSVLGSIGDAIASIPENTADILTGLNGGAEGAINGTLGAIDSFDKAVSAKLDEHGIPSRLSLTDDEGNFDPSLKLSSETEDKPSPFEGRLNLSRQPDTLAGQTTKGLSQFIIGMAGAGKFTGISGVKGAFVNGAIADGVVFDPNDGNLSNLMAEHEVAIPFLTEALSTDPEDPEWLNRMRNVTEGAFIGGAVDTLIRGLKGVSLKVKGDKIGGAEGDALIAKGNEEVAGVADELEAMDEFGVPDVPAAPIEAPKPQIKLRKEKPIVDGKTLRDSLAGKETVTLEDLNSSEWFNTSKMDGPVEAQAMIETVGKALDESGALAKLGLDGPETLEATLKGATEELAEMVGVGTKQFERRLKQMAHTGKDTAKTIVAGKMTLQTVGSEINKVASQLDNLTANGQTDATIEGKLIDLLETHGNVQAHLKSVQTAAARATSAGRIRTADGLASEALDKVAQYGGSEKLKKLASQLKEMNGPAQRAKLIRQVVKSRKTDVLNEYTINSMLSGFKTHMVNISSNAYNIAILPGERIMGGTYQGLRGQGFKQAREGAEQYMAYRSVVMDAARLAGKSFKKEAPILDNAVKIEYSKNGGKAISASAMGVDENTIGGKLLDGVGKAVRLPGRALQAEDEFFKQLLFRSRLKAQLTVAAGDLASADLTKSGYTSKGEFIEAEFDKSFNSLQSLSDDWTEMVDLGKVADDTDVKEAWLQEHLGGFRGGNKRAEDALRVARDGTFTTPLAKGTPSHSFQQLANKHPLTRQLTPFIQTPVNIMNKAFDRTPLINATRERYRARLTSPDASIRAEAEGEMATGVAIISALYMLASEGRITGHGPNDGKRRANWNNDKNWQASSVNMGTSEIPDWVEVDRLDPHMFLFGVVGDITEMSQVRENDPTFDGASLIAMGLSAMGNNLTDKTWLSGVSEAIEVISSKDRPDIAERWVQNKVASLVPFSALGRQINQALTEEQKEARGYIDKIKANIPGMADSLPTRYNWVTGKEMESPSHYLAYIKHKEGDGDIVTKEMRRLDYGFSGPDRRIGEIPLSSEMYQSWARLMGTVRIGGRTLHERLERTINTNRYDLERNHVQDGIVAPSESHRVELLAINISRYKAKARQVLMDEFPDLKDAHINLKKFKSRAKRGKAQEGERDNLILGF